MMNDEQIKSCAADAAAYMVGVRRDLHRIPEPGFEEFETQAYIKARLDELGIAYTTERTWIVAQIEGAKKGKCVAFRADMDSLPLEEAVDVPFRSCHPGRMHACGHDAHCAILLGAAKILSEHKDAFTGTVKLLFQPAEETVGGAAPMVKAGCLKSPHVDWVFGLHLMPHLPVGAVETKAGTLNASTDDIEIKIHGKSGHGAHPEGGVDAIVCAAQVITALQTLVSRNTDPTRAAAVHIGMIEGGAAYNIICDLVTMKGTLRTADSKLRAFLKKRIRELSAGVSGGMGCTAQVNLTPDYAALVNHSDEAALVLRLAARLFGRQNAIVKDAPSLGGEDFSAFIEHTPGAFFHIGCADPARMPASPLHSRTFDPDERCFPVGAAMEVALVMELLGK